MIGVAQMKRVCGRARCAIGVAQIYESRVVGARMCDRGHSKWTHHNPREGSLKMGSDALKATILDRGHSTEASRGVEHQFAAPRSSRKQPDTGARGGTRKHAKAREGRSAGIFQQPRPQSARKRTAEGRQPQNPPVWPHSAFFTTIRTL